MMQKRAIAAGLAAVLLSISPAFAQPRDAAPSAETLDYQVQPGDTLIDLATAYLNRPADYRQVQRRNRVADPRQLAIGRTLAFPVELLRADPDQARVAGFRGDVTLRQGLRPRPPSRDRPCPRAPS